ncbi:MAG: hypothetical protein GEU80_02525 [Dehalococcoidia bacterium]|nr:hypothetical protein [Dehalococcoidia bacterium]
MTVAFLDELELARKSDRLLNVDALDMVHEVTFDLALAIGAYHPRMAVRLVADIYGGRDWATQSLDLLLGELLMQFGETDARDPAAAFASKLSFGEHADEVPVEYLFRREYGIVFMGYTGALLAHGLYWPKQSSQILRTKVTDGIGLVSVLAPDEERLIGVSQRLIEDYHDERTLPPVDPSFLDSVRIGPRLS